MSDQDGYHRLATLMTKDQRIAIFRRFDFVNLLGLLSLQAEIAELEADFRYQARADKTSRDPEEEMFSEWFQLLRKAQNGQSAQYEKLKTLRTKMKEYNDLLLQVSRLNSLDAAESSQLKELRSWLMNPKGGNDFLKQSESRLWEDEDGSSFVCVGKASGEHDMFTKFVTWFLVSVLHRYCCLPKWVGRVVDTETGMVSYSDSRLIRTTAVATTVLASIIPILSIFVLYVVKNTYGRIGIAAGFTTSFAIFLASFSSARRVEIFAATATFAAVEVVFIGSALDSKP